MKFTQLIADANGALKYGLDPWGNVWCLEHVGTMIGARVLDLRIIDRNGQPAHVHGPACRRRDQFGYWYNDLCQEDAAEAVVANAQNKSP